MFLSQKPAFYIRDTFSEPFLLWALPTLPSFSLGSAAPTPPTPDNWIGASVLLLFAFQRGAVVYCILEMMGAAVTWGHCLRGSAHPRPVLHSEPKSLLGLGYSSAKGRDSQMLLIVFICFSKRRMLVPRKRASIEGQSINCRLNTQENDPTV